MTSDEIASAFRRPQPLLTQQPYKAVYVAIKVATLVASIPFRLLYYLPRRSRPLPSWSLLQSFVISIVRWNFDFVSNQRPQATTSLQPQGANGPEERFDLVEPVPASKLVGVASRTSIKAEARPATWYPSRYDPKTDGGKKVILHFFGGAHVVGTHFVSAHKGTLDVLLPALGEAKFFAVNYRLASVKGQQFPAELIDAISTFAHLQAKGVPAADIILLGDSAGGHLCLSLVRYLTEHPELSLGLPGAALLTSPWVDMSIPIETYTKHPCYNKDVLPRNILEWGVDAFLPGNMSLTDPYISPGVNPFHTEVPLFLGVGDSEIFLEQITRFASSMKAITGNTVFLYVSKDDVHSSFMFSYAVGFAEQIEAYVERMRVFLASQGLLSTGEN